MRSMAHVHAIVLGTLLSPIGFALAQDAAPVAPEAPAQLEPTTRSLTFAEERAEHKRLIEEEFAPLPRRAAMPIEKIVSLAVEGGHLHVQSVLPPTEGTVAIDAPNWPGFMHVTVGDPKLLAFHLKHVDISKPDQIATYTQVITSVDYLQISRDIESEKEFMQVTLIQSRMFADENEDPIRVLVRITPSEDDAETSSLTISGPSFDALCKANAPELRKYLLPVLKDLGAGRLLRSSDAPLAWQVFGPAIEPTPKTQARVADLLKRLSAEDFKTRAAAEDELTKPDAELAAGMSRVDLSSYAPDPRGTAENFIRSQQPVSAERAKVLQSDPGFLLDSLLLDDPRLRAAAESRFKEVTHMPLDLPATLSPSEREQRVDALRAKFVPTTQPTTKPAQPK